MRNRGFWLHKKGDSWYSGTEDAPPETSYGQENMQLLDFVAPSYLSGRGASPLDFIVIFRIQKEQFPLWIDLFLHDSLELPHCLHLE